jgi:hypothetical protein
MIDESDNCFSSRLDLDLLDPNDMPYCRKPLVESSGRIFLPGLLPECCPSGFKGPRIERIEINKFLFLLNYGWLPFLNTYRTMCLAPSTDFRRVLEDVRELRLAA